MSVQDSESRRFEQTFGWIILRSIFAHDLPRNYFFRGFWKVRNFFSKICAHSERYRYLLAGVFEILTFYGNIAFSIVTGIIHKKLSGSAGRSLSLRISGRRFKSRIMCSFLCAIFHFVLLAACINYQHFLWCFWTECVALGPAFVFPPVRRHFIMMIATGSS